MNAKPIIFNGEMVRALVAGKKTQTRRIVKHSKQFSDWDAVPSDAYDVMGGPSAGGNGEFCFLVAGDHGYTDGVSCPYGLPDDLLYVRETFCYKYDSATGVVMDPDEFWYRATEKKEVVKFDGDGFMATNVDGSQSSPWTPSIHMPRKASRLTLRITDVRVQQIQDISEEDAKAEGVLREDLPPSPDAEYPPGSYGYVSGLHPFPDGSIYARPTEAFEELWDSINEKRGYGWDANPWVWCVSFEVIHKNVDKIIEEVE